MYACSTPVTLVGTNTRIQKYLPSRCLRVKNKQRKWIGHERGESSGGSTRVIVDLNGLDVCER